MNDHVNEDPTDERRILVDHLAALGVSSSVLEALDRVPREQFVPARLKSAAYVDSALPIECGQTISQPTIVAMMTEALCLSGHERVLEIGTGSGYQAAILAELASSVVTIERHGELAQQAAARLKQLGYQNVLVLHGDGTLGCPEHAPFDRIIVTAAADECPPALFQQLGEGGILVAPVGDVWGQMLLQIRKINGLAVPRTLCECAFVPLVSDRVAALSDAAAAKAD